jgi:hypothetical protein
MRRLSLLVLVTALAATAVVSTAAAAGFSGAWTKTISSGPTVLKGRWTLQAAGGKFWIQKGARTTHLVDGAVAVSGSTLAFTDRKGPLACKGASAVGKYRKTTTSSGFKLTAVHDTCPGRKLLLTSGAWAVARG